MKCGRHQIRMQWNCLTHTPDNPTRIALDNGDFETNMRIESMQILPMSTDRDTNNRDFSGGSTFVVVALTSDGAQPLDLPSVNARPYALRGCDRRQIGWGTIESNDVNTILDPHNIVSGDLWVNAWTLSSGKEPAALEEDVFLLITMEQVKQTGSEALLSAVRDDPLD